MLKFGVPNYTVKKCSDFVAVLWVAMKPLADLKHTKVYGCNLRRLSTRDSKKGLRRVLI